MQKYIFLGTLFITPLLFLTFTSNFFSTPKQIFLIAATLLLLLNLAYSSFTKKSISLSTTPLKSGLIAISFAIVINLLINPVNRLESLIGPGSLYLALCIWAYFISMENSTKFKESVIYMILGSSFIVSLHSLAQVTFLYKLVSIPIYMQSRAFFLTGSPLSAFLIILIGTIISLYLTLNSTKSRSIFALSTTIHTIALIALGALIVPGQELATNLLPLKASWNIALDAMKSARSFFFGVGLSNFPLFYNSVKPLFLNSTSFWNTLPSTSTSEVLQILTTTGIIGLLSFILLPLLAFKSDHAKDPIHVALKLVLLVSLITLTFAPGSVSTLLIFFTALGLVSSSDAKVQTLNTPTHLIISFITLIVVGLLSFYTSKVVLAETSMRNAQIAIKNNDGKSLYEHNLRAIEFLPSMTSYHLTYSQVNLSLATALSQKESLSDTERANITTLVSQAIREGKTAISLSPSNSGAWQNLGFIYQKLINVADGSDGFAIDSYAQAVKLDPGNPSLRLEYGGLLYQLGQASKDQDKQISFYSRAQSEFQTAIQLKPDYANAYYNLAKLLESVKDYANSATIMQKAISLLGPDNPDLNKANGELEAIKTKVPKATPVASAKPSATSTPIVEVNPETQIAAPSPLPSPIDGGPLDIPVTP